MSEKSVCLSTSYCFLLVLFILLPVKANTCLAQSQADSLWSLSAVRADTNGDKKLDYAGEEATITGIANIGSGILHEHYLQAYLQNDSTGLSIFNKDIKTPFSAGDSLVMNGTIQRYNGMAELHVRSYKVFPNVREELQPKALTKAIYHPQKYLGMLVEGEGTIIEKGTMYNGKFLRISPPDSSGASIMVYVSNFHVYHKDFDFDVLSIGDRISIKGIVGEYNPDFPEERTYKIFLRRPEDLNCVGLPSYYWNLGGGVLALIGLLIVGWIFILRRQVNKQTQQLQRSVKEKDALLREIHHRVKNSLSIVSGLIGLQLDSTDNEAAQNVLTDSQSRIKSVALIHEKLYETDSLADVKLDVYLKDLVRAIHSTFTEYNEAVDLQFDMETVDIDVDKVIPCGLLINELVVNAFKHAFSKDHQGLLKIKLKQLDESVELIVADNGPGLPDDFTMNQGDSLGSMLISTFASQLEADTNIKNTDSGSAFIFTFPVN